MDNPDVKARSRMSWWISAGGVLAGLAVTMGALGAHGVGHYLAEHYSGQTREVAGRTVPAAQKYLEDFNTASRYQIYHALGMILVGLLGVSHRSRLLQIAGMCFLMGIVLFSGGLYCLALMSYTLSESARHGIGLTAATGGTLFIIGWLCLAAAVCPCRCAETSST